MFYERAEDPKAANSPPDTNEAEALAAALNRSAERVQNLWFSFLIFMVYLAIAAGTTTHRMLFLEEPLNLPVLNIKLPLLGFYILTPIIFVTFHFYMLLNLVLLARTAKSFEEALARVFPEDGEPRENFRMRIENTLFVQLLVGGRLERDGINATLLSLMAFITLALAPVVLLLMIQIKFLPYHSEWITWLHRGLLALDLALVWTLWPGYRSGWGVRLWPKRFWAYVWLGALSAVALPYAVMVATFPDEHMYLATNWLHRSPDWNPGTRGVLLDGPKWHVSIVPVNTLDLHWEDLIDDAKLKQIIEKNENPAGANRWAETLSLKERDLTGANLEGTDLRHGNFIGAILNRANLNVAWAEKARFNRAQLRGALLIGARLQGAYIAGAQLQGASLDYAQLQGAKLSEETQVLSASLQEAQHQGRSPQDVTRTFLSHLHVPLEAGWLGGDSGAELQGASLNTAYLQGADLSGVQLQGAVLGNAHLQGAALNNAQLQGASLNGAQLQGASLNAACLQGASFEQAQLQSASLIGVCIGRGDARHTAAWIDTRIVRRDTDPKANYLPKCDSPETSFAVLQQLITKKVPEGEARRKAIDRIEKRLKPNMALEAEEMMEMLWDARERMPPTTVEYEKSLTRHWHALGCAPEGAPYVLQGLIAQLAIRHESFPYASPFSDQSDAVKDLAKDFLGENCAGARELAAVDKATLQWIRDSTRAQAPTP